MNNSIVRLLVFVGISVLLLLFVLDIPFSNAQSAFDDEPAQPNTEIASLPVENKPVYNSKSDSEAKELSNKGADLEKNEKEVDNKRPVLLKRNPRKLEKLPKNEPPKPSNKKSKTIKIEN